MSAYQDVQFVSIYVELISGTTKSLKTKKKCLYEQEKYVNRVNINMYNVHFIAKKS